VRFTGNLTAQGATTTDGEWYNVDVKDLNTGNTVSNIAFSNSTDRLGINVEGFHPYVRLELGIASGNITDILYR
jgi:hypothetical protein